MMKYRCSKCQTRHKFGPLQLEHHPRCKKCGSFSFYRVKSERTCYCDAYHFPHRAGGGECEMLVNQSGE